MEKTICKALISVYHKDGLSEILRELHRAGVGFLSTGGTRTFIESQGYACEAVESITEFPELLGGRVKTLHPAVFGGILARRTNASDQEELLRHNIPLIDLVIVDLYPFEATVASGASEEDVIEKIDIGGISLIRAAAKNYQDTLVVASQAQYPALLELLQRRGGVSTLAERKSFACRAFAVSSHYDTAIFNYMDGYQQSALRISCDHATSLRYGENPHQGARFWGELGAYFEQLHGKELSYNNLQDVEVAVQLMQDYVEPSFAILKHNNACGFASAKTIGDAYDFALACDPVSAFGGVLIANRMLDKEVAERIHQLFCEVLIAPAYTDEALEVLKGKKNRIILLQKQPVSGQWGLRSALGGLLQQAIDHVVETKEHCRAVTDIAPNEAETEELLFANKLVKHSKSNAIVLTKGKRLLASGVGQTSRVDALRSAIDKARSFGFDLRGAVMASDAFFPFADCVELAGEAGIKAIIQPGGSIRDEESIAKANELGIAMVFTGIRHFRH